MSDDRINIDEAIELLIEGKRYREIAEHFDVGLSTLHAKFSKPEHFARVAQALQLSGDTYAEKAEHVLIEANWNPTWGDFDLRKAKELSQFYRWQAAKRNPRKYSEKVDIDHTTNGKEIKSVPAFSWAKDSSRLDDGNTT